MKNIRGTFFKILLRKRNNDFILDNKSLLDNYTEIKPRLGHWAADPFVIKIGNSNLLFAEMCSLFTGNGYIAYMNLDEGGRKWKTVIKDQTHYSFPFIYNDKNNLYILPENCQKLSIVKYKITFNLNKISIRQDMVIMEKIKAVDSVIYDIGTKCFLFTYILDATNHLDIYLLSGSTTMLIKSMPDVHNTLRPAGKIFEYNNKIILPTQNNEYGYGGSIFFNSVEISQENINISNINNFSIPRTFKDQYNGCHTFNFNNEYEVIDVRYKKFSSLRIIGKIYRVLCKPRKEKPLKQL